MPKITLNGKVINAKRGSTILETAYDQGLKLPTLCFMKDVNEIGYCRMCVVEINNNKDLVASCVTPVQRGMDIQTHSKRVRESRTSTLSILATRHKFNCWTCARGDGSCDFYEYLKDYNVSDDMFKEPKGRFAFVVEGEAINMDEHKCVLCRRCVSTCNEVVTARVFKYRDDNPEDPVVSPAPGLSFDEAGCISCGACTVVCPVGALIETSHIERVEKALRDPNTYVVAQIEPTVKSAIGEAFGYGIGEAVDEVEAKLLSAMMELGFDEVQDISQAASVHAKEQAQMLASSDQMMFTSSNAGWIRYIEMYQPDFLEHLSPLKSPHLMNAAMLREEYDQPKKLYIVTITPSTAAKYEISRSEHQGLVDASLTTRELSRMVQKQPWRFKRLPVSDGVQPASNGSLYGVVGGELYATFHELAQMEQSPITFNLSALHKFEDGIAETQVKIGKKSFRVAVVHGGKAMSTFFKNLPSMKKSYDIVEFHDMFGGLINGGGQPIVSEDFLFGWNVARMRTTGYLKAVAPSEAAQHPIYPRLIQEPGSPESRKLFATSFSKKPFTRK
jgi:NADP-reducing hydrogenase subunit HndD